MRAYLALFVLGLALTFVGAYGVAGGFGASATPVQYAAALCYAVRHDQASLPKAVRTAETITRCAPGPRYCLDLQSDGKCPAGTETQMYYVFVKVTRKGEQQLIRATVYGDSNIDSEKVIWTHKVPYAGPVT